MIVREKALEVINGSLAILFNEGKVSIPIVRTSFIDTEAALLVEMSMLNQKMSELLEFNKELIKSEYIDYLNTEINIITEKTMSENAAKKLSRLALSMRNTSRSFTDEELRERISSIEGKISTLVQRDIIKSSELKPIINSKVNDLIINLEDRINNIQKEYMNLYKSVNDCETFIECCDFCNFLFKNNPSSTEGYLPILEEPYEKIVKELTKKYYLFKEEPECPYL